MYTSESSFNEGRKKAFATFVETLKELIGKSNITEKQFRDSWQEKLQRAGSIIADGWYTPPPKGMAVLSGDIAYPSRVSFETLRKEGFWPSDKIINWETDLLYVYCSPVNIISGMPGDFAITLYFGKSEKVREHFRHTHQAINEIFAVLPKQKTSLELFEVSEAIFKAFRLQNCVTSFTDHVPLDLGHTFPQIELNRHNDNLTLTEQQKDTFRVSRQFINMESSWTFTEGLQFTIEPQLISLEDLELPQITYHYLVQCKDGFQICIDVDTLLRQFELI